MTPDDMAAFLSDYLVMKREVSELRRLLANMVKVATVAETDGAKGYRLSYGDDDTGKPVLGPWQSHPESGGAFKSWVPLKKGEIVATLNPSGDDRQGVLMRGGFSQANAQPSGNLQENVWTYGQVRIEVREAEILVTIGGARIRLTPEILQAHFPDVEWTVDG